MNILKIYFERAMLKATINDNSPAKTHTKVYMKVSRAWDERVETLFLSHRYFPWVIIFSLWNSQTSNVWLIRYALIEPIKKIGEYRARVEMASWTSSDDFAISEGK